MATSTTSRARSRRPRSAPSRRARNLIGTNIFGRSIVARTPGSKRVLLVMPDTIAGKGHGYRIFFVDSETKAVTEAKVPITPKSGKPDDFTFHLQAIDLGAGPVLLYWNDVAGNDVTVRGRFITGLDQYQQDFVISRKNGADRSFSLTQVTEPYWYGDYQTAGAYKSPTVLNAFIYRPLWVEPDQTVHYGHVIYTPLALSGATPQVVAPKGIVSVAKEVPLTAVPLNKDSEEYRRRQRARPRPNP